MNKTPMDEGLIEVLLEKLEKQELPRLLDISKKVDNGNRLEDFDIEFLEATMKAAKSDLPLVDRHPKYQKLAAQVIEIYKDITEKSLLLEKKS